MHSLPLYREYIHLYVPFSQLIWEDSLFPLPHPKLGFPGGLVVKNLPGMQEIRLDPWVRKIPLEKGMSTHFSILAWRIPRRALWGTVHGVATSPTGLSN